MNANETSTMLSRLIQVWVGIILWLMEHLLIYATGQYCLPHRHLCCCYDILRNQLSNHRLCKIISLDVISDTEMWFLLSPSGGYDTKDKAAMAYDLATLKYWDPGTHINLPIHVMEKFHASKLEL
jgi:hypothetical protein